MVFSIFVLITQLTIDALLYPWKVFSVRPLTASAHSCQSISQVLVDETMPKNITVQLGAHAYLPCTVYQLKKESVSL